MITLFSRVLRDYTPLSRSVGWSVPFSIFSVFLSLLSLPLLPICSGGLLQHCSCPPARDWGSRVSGLVQFRKWH